MGKWSNQDVTLEPIAFDGDAVVFTVSRLTVEDMLVLSKHFDTERGTMRFSSPMEVCAAASTVLPARVKAVSGYRKSDGEAMTLDEFLSAAKEFYFVPLISALFAALVGISVVGTSEKNLPAPSPESSEV